MEARARACGDCRLPLSPVGAWAGSTTWPMLGAENLSHTRHNRPPRARAATSLVPAATAGRPRSLKDARAGSTTRSDSDAVLTLRPDASACGDAGCRTAPRAYEPGRRRGQPRALPTNSATYLSSPGPRPGAGDVRPLLCQGRPNGPRPISPTGGSVGRSAGRSSSARRWAGPRLPELAVRLGRGIRGRLRREQHLRSKPGDGRELAPGAVAAGPRSTPNFPAK